MKNKGFLDATNIKIIAIVFMLADHIHQMFYSFGAPIWLTYLGRVVFPLFLFVVADSFHYTRNRKKYMLRLLFASWAMTLLTVVLQWILPNKEIVLMNNAFSTFFVAGLYIIFWDLFVSGIRDKNARKIISAILLCFVPILASFPALLVVQLTEHLPLQTIRILLTLSLLIPNILLVEGGFAMVMLGVAFYIFRKSRLAQLGILLLLSAVVFIVNPGIQWLMVFAAVPMLLYNGERGRGLKWFFYIFYPAHIAVLYIAATLLAG